MQFCSVRLSVALRLGGICVFGAGLASAEASGVAGTWRGESVCTTNAPACRNESVVYYVEDIPDRPDFVIIKADKIVNGKPITMGTSEWQHVRAQHTLEWRTPEQVWLLKVIGNRIEGTLIRADKAVFRKITLEKNE
jgi:hypothetical protein